MKTRSLIRMSGLSGILAGVLLVLLGLAFILSVFIGETALAASGIFLTLSKIFETFLLFGIFSTQLAAHAKAAPAALVLSVSGLMVDLFPPFGRVLFILGLFLFALSSRKNKALPSWAFWLWFGGAAVALVSSLLGIRLGMGMGALISAAAVFLLGSALRKNQNVT